jgi:CHAD domain-containing protein
LFAVIHFTELDGVSMAMHHKQLLHIVDKRFQALFALWPGMHALGIEEIHDWRVEFKKLRALVRMSDGEKKKLEMPLSLKDVYSIAGEIRDRQMQLERLREWFVNELLYPPQYTQLIKQEISDFGDQLHPMTENDAILRISEHKIKSALPSKVSKKDIRVFLQKQLFEIRNILWLTYKKDDYLHSCRKHLKDLQYIIDAIGASNVDQESITGLPTFEQLQLAAQELGNFNDQCVTLVFLSSSYLNRLPGDEKIILASYKSKLQKEKTRYKNKLISSLEILFAKLL